MSGGFNNPVVGGEENLVREAIQSPNYVPGSAGWSINRDGSAEFNDGIFRGGVVVSGPGGQILVYAPAPALDTLIFSLSSVAGTDTYGNTYPAGIGLARGGFTDPVFLNWAINGISSCEIGVIGGTPNVLAIEGEQIQMSSNNGNVIIKAGSTGAQLDLQADLVNIASGSPLAVGAGPIGMYYSEEVASAAQVIPSGVATQLINLTLIDQSSDYGSAWNLTTGLWTCPVTSDYDFTVATWYTAGAAGIRACARVSDTFNTAPFLGQDERTTTIVNMPSLCSFTKRVTTGTTLQVEVIQISGAARTLDPTSTYVKICRRL